MPCEGGGSSYDNADKEIDKLTRLLCQACRAWPRRVLMPKTLALWWKRHELEDRERIKEMQRSRVESIAQLRRDRNQIDGELRRLLASQKK